MRGTRRRLLALGFLLGWSFLPSASKDLALYHRSFDRRIPHSGSATVSLWVVNETTESMENVSLSVTGPPGWLARLEPDFFGSLTAGGEFRLIVKPPRSLFEQEGRFKVGARSAVCSDELTIRFTAMPPPLLWPGVGVTLAAVAIAAFVWVYRQSGRRERVYGGKLP